MKSPAPKSFFPGPVLVCLPFLVLYLITALPGLGWRDTPEFASTAWTLGIAHPAGFPTFNLATKVLTYLPLGSIPFRVTLAAALFGAAILFVLYGLIVRGSAIVGRDDPDDPGIRWAAAIAVTVFGLSGTLWTNSTEPEVYTLNTLLLGITLYCALRWSADGREAWLCAGGLIYGLAAGNHGSVAFYVPGFLVYVLLHSSSRVGRNLLLLLFFFLVGFSVYLYLPIRGSADPPLDFGHPVTLERFLMHITDRKDAADHFDGVRKGHYLARHTWLFLTETTPRLFWPLGLPLLLAGAVRVWRRDWPLLTALFWASLADVLFFIRWTSQPAAFLPAYFFTAFFCGLGLVWLVGRIEAPPWLKPTRAQAAGAALLVLVLAGGVWLVYPQQDRSATFLPGESFRSDYERMAPDAISLTGVQWFHQRAFQDVYRLRDDVTAISLADFTFPWFYSPITQARFPRVVVPAGDVNYQAGQGWFLKRFLEANLDRKRDIYWEPFDLKGGVFSRHLKPELDLLFKVTPRPVDRLSPEETRAALGRLREKIEREIATEGFYEAEELDVYYVLMLFQYAFYFSRHGQIGAAMATLRFLEDLYGPEGANRMLPADHAALNINMGLMLASEQRWGEAVPRFEAALDHARGNFRFWFGLGLSLMKTGRLAKARSALERAAGLAPYDPETRLYLGDVFRLQGDTARARAAYERAWHLAREPRTKMEIKERLGELGG